MALRFCGRVWVGLLFAVSSPLLAGGEDVLRFPHRGRLIDMAVAPSGESFILNESGYDELDTASGRVIPRRFDPTALGMNLLLQRTANLAISTDGSGRPVILWRGRLADGSTHFFVSHTASRETVELAPIGLKRVLDFAICSDGSLVIVGLLTAAPSPLVHEFRADGEHIRSYHTPDATASEEPGYSVAAVTGDSVYLVHGIKSSRVHQYQAGRLVATYELGSDGKARFVWGMAASPDTVWVHAVSGTESKVTDQTGSQTFTAMLGGEQELWAIRGRTLTLVESGLDVAAPILGVLPDGRFAAAKLRGAGAPFLERVAIQVQ
ncbi:MAG: hypothetical protein Kow001_07610 [Acidobacteriota bacterium]